MFEIRRTVEADAGELQRIRLAALRSDPTAFGASLADVIQYGPEVWKERAIGSETVANFLAWSDDRAVGMVAGYVAPDAPGRVELVSMWIDPSARGSRLGPRLVEQVTRWAAERGIPEARLWVTRGIEPAERLYARCGFTLTAEVGVAASDPCRQEVRMVRSAASP